MSDTVSPSVGSPSFKVGFVSSLAANVVQGASGAASVKKSNLESALDEMSSHSLVEEMEGLETLLVYSKNLILFPDEKKYRKVKL